MGEVLIMKYVSALTEEQIKRLEYLMKNDPSSRVRIRSHSILLSARGFTINEIAKIYQVDRDTVSLWIDLWEREGFAVLHDKPRSGRPSELTEEEKGIAIELIKQHPQSIKTVVGEIAQKTNKTVSVWTLKRIAKAAKMTWKRIKKSMKSKRDDKEFERAKQEIQQLKLQHRNGEIDLYYFDECGFCLEPTVPYAWQPIREVIEVPASKSGRLNVLGFLSLDSYLESFTFEDSIDSDVVVTCFDYLGKNITKKTVVIIDNAPTHTSERFNDNIERWKKRGLFIKRIPPYCAELNLIEILWRFIKYRWLPFSAYQSFKDLTDSAWNILKCVGSKYRISFA